METTINNNGIEYNVFTSYCTIKEQKWICASSDDEEEVCVLVGCDNVINTWRDFNEKLGFKINYRTFCSLVQAVRYEYYSELDENSERNARAYARYWAGTRGKSYSHYKREYAGK